MVHYLTEELVRRGHEVTLFATSDSSTAAHLVPVLPYPMSKGALFDLTPTHYALMAASKAAEMSGEFDIIHSHLGPIAYYFSRLARCPFVETVHSASVLCASTAQDEFLRPYYLDRQARLERVHHVFVSDNQRRRSGLSHNTSVIYNGIGFDDFTFSAKPQEYFAYLGYLTPEKGAHLAVQAAVHTGAPLKLAGSFYGCEEYFAREIEPYLQTGRIEYVGVLDPRERNAFLRGARALLFPVNWEEPFGLVMVEAMACGTPVIGFNRASVPEVIASNVSGFVVEDLTGMEAAMEKVDLLDRAACRRYVEENFSAAKMADEYEKVYAAAISQIG
jgi:glycosyltransferase involved in cell wall biosynthesis